MRTVYGEVDDSEELERRLERSLGVLETRTQNEGAEKNKRGRKRRAEEEENGEENGEQDSDDE